MKLYKKQIKEIFDRTRHVFCPAFVTEKIIFNAKGINHLIYKGDRSRREISRIETNIRLLPRAITLLSGATFYQEESNYKREGQVYRFWAFEAVVEGRRIKVVVRQVGKGKKHFWSVIPAWRKDLFEILNAKNRKLEKE